MSILIKTVRVCGFRGLENIEVSLDQTTVLTGMNNTGKTSFLKAIQIASGKSQFISQDDFFVSGNLVSDKIIVDLLIVPIGAKGIQSENFSENWENLFTTNRIKIDSKGTSFVPIRTILTFDSITNNYKAQQYILKQWPEFKQGRISWFEDDNGKQLNSSFDQIPFFFMDARRDILEDIKLKSSYLGKMLSKIEYDKAATDEIESQIKSLNDVAVNKSSILSTIKNTLKELDTAMDTNSEGIEITPFTKKIRDLNKGLSIYYTDNKDSFAMEYHGMGTRSWSALLTLKSFISLLSENALKKQDAFFPILAIEEPEAHLHPNAQKKLYAQINTIPGQKIISTHSPYIAATAKLGQIRNFHKDKAVTCGKIETKNLLPEDIRKIERQVLNTRGEIFFSKLIILFEGETEEQALPIFAQEYFGKSPVEMGLDFVGVGGHQSYLTFLRFAEAFNIPWLIFSDAERAIETSVKKQFKNCGSGNKLSNCVVFVDTGNDFEKQLIKDGFTDEIKKAIASFDVYTNEKHRAVKEPQRLIEIEKMTDEELYNVITKRKTQYGPAIAEQIVQSSKYPPKVIELFGKIIAILNIKKVEA